jgi:hypothetical protein
MLFFIMIGVAAMARLINTTAVWAFAALLNACTWTSVQNPSVPDRSASVITAAIDENESLNKFAPESARAESCSRHEPLGWTRTLVFAFFFSVISFFPGFRQAYIAYREVREKVRLMRKWLREKLKAMSEAYFEALHAIKQVDISSQADYLCAFPLMFAVADKVRKSLTAFEFHSPKDMGKWKVREFPDGTGWITLFAGGGMFRFHVPKRFRGTDYFGWSEAPLTVKRNPAVEPRRAAYILRIMVDLVEHADFVRGWNLMVDALTEDLLTRYVKDCIHLSRVDFAGFEQVGDDRYPVFVTSVPFIDGLDFTLRPKAEWKDPEELTSFLQAHQAQMPSLSVTEFTDLFNLSDVRAFQNAVGILKDKIRKQYEECEDRAKAEAKAKAEAQAKAQAEAKAKGRSKAKAKAQADALAEPTNPTVDESASTAKGKRKRKS